jgi:hypothetical protein
MIVCGEPGSVIKVDRSGAFTVNRVGLAGTPFPLSITVS